MYKKIGNIYLKFLERETPQRSIDWIFIFVHENSLNLFIKILHES